MARTEPCTVAHAMRCRAGDYTGSLTTSVRRRRCRPAARPAVGSRRAEREPVHASRRNPLRRLYPVPARVLQLYRVASFGGASHVGCSDHRGVARRRGKTRASHPCLDGRRRHAQAARGRGHVVWAAALLRRAAERPGRRCAGPGARAEHPLCPSGQAGRGRRRYYVVLPSGRVDVAPVPGRGPNILSALLGKRVEGDLESPRGASMKDSLLTLPRLPSPTRPRRSRAMASQSAS